MSRRHVTRFASLVTTREREPWPWKPVRFRRVGENLYPMTRLEWVSAVDETHVVDRLRLYSPTGHEDVHLGVRKGLQVSFGAHMHVLSLEVHT